MRRILPALAAAGFIVAGPPDATASSHMDAPLIVLDDAANTTDVYAFVREQNGRKSLVTALGVYPFEEPGIGPNKFNFDDNVLYAIHVALGKDVAAGRPTISYEFRFTTRYKNRRTILQSYLGVVNDVNDAAQNLTQFYSVTKVDHRAGKRTRLGTGIVPPNNQGIATPFYNQGDDGEQPAKEGVATADQLDRYTQQSIASLDDGYLAFAGQRDDGFYGDIQAVFDLLQLRNPGQDAQRGFNLHLMALAIPIDELGGDLQMAGVYATTSRERVTILFDGQLKPERGGDWVQVARQGNPLFNEGLVAIEDKDLYSRTSPALDNVLFRKYAEKPELAKLLNLIVLEPDIPGHRDGPHGHRRHLHPRSHQGGPLDEVGAARRRRSRPPDESRRSRLLAAGHLRRRRPDQQDPARLRRRRHPRRLAERPPLRRRRRRHRGDGVDQRSAHQPAGHPRSRPATT